MNLVGILRKARTLHHRLAHTPTATGGPASHRAVEVESGGDGYTVIVRVAVSGRKYALLGKGERTKVRLKQNIEQLVDGLLRAPHPTREIKQLAGQLSSAAAQPAAETVAARTKERQCTIQVHASARLHDAIEEYSAAGTFSTAAREIFERGLDSLEERLWSESSTRVLAEFAAASSEFEGGDARQWSLRLSRGTYLRAAFVAQEHGLSKSKLAAMCIATALHAFAPA